MRVSPLFPLIKPALTKLALTKLILMGLLLTSAVRATSQSVRGAGERGAGQEEDAIQPPMTTGSRTSVSSEFLEPGANPENRLFRPFLKHMTDDQREFWGSAKQLSRPDALKTFLPFAGFTGLLIAGDSWITRQVPNNANDLKRSQDFSNYGAISLAAVAGGSYALGQFTGNDHLSETGFLSGEAALNSTLIAYALKEATERQRPYDGTGNGHFFLRGSSFPSEHAALAWSVASIVAHEYPGPLTKLMAYSMASAVTIARVTGKQHFSSDVVVGSALGWYLGRQIFRARHDPELGGGAWGNLRDDTEERAQREARPPQSMGSPSVPLDSWVYPALEKIAAFGLVESAFIGLKPWSRMECAQLTEEAGEALEREEGSGNDLAGLQSRLRQEFAYEFGLLDGQPNATVSIESVYTRGVSASGPVLTDGYHFGQTFSYDFGRPFQRGTNGQTGGSFYAALGPAALYVRAEFQHAPSAPPLSEAVRDFISTSDLVPVPPAEPFQTRERTGARGALSALVATSAIVLAILFFSRDDIFPRGLFVCGILALFILTLLMRALLRRIFRQRRGWGKPTEILIIGADCFAHEAAERLQRLSFAPCQIAGYVLLPGQDPAPEASPAYRFDQIAQLSASRGFHEAIIALQPVQFVQIPAIVEALEKLCVPARAIVDLGEGIVVREKLFQLGRIQMLDLTSTPADLLYYALLKRAFDIAFSALVLFITTPLFGLVALLIRLTSPGPIVFTQERIGLNGQKFQMYKFRTMHVSARNESDTTWTTANDPRRTRLGELLRRTSIDELPQFINVLKGDMSVVGPRPERPYFVEKFLKEIRRYNHRHSLKVGITGWAQLHGWRGDTSIEKRLEHDLYYLQNWSFAFDLRIVAMTVLSALTNKNAY